jgi:hypothetical protein
MTTFTSSNERTTLYALLVSQPLHLLHRHQSTTGWQYRNTCSQSRTPARTPRRPCETAARQLGQDPASRTAVTAGQLLCGL